MMLSSICAKETYKKYSYTTDTNRSQQIVDTRSLTTIVANVASGTMSVHSVSLANTKE
jgi:hypothetical protein